MVDFGADFYSNFELLSPGGHFKIVKGIDNALQAVVNRLTTIPGDLDALGFDEYGNYAYKYLGATDIPYAKALIKEATIEALIREPVVQSINDVSVDYKIKKCIVDNSFVLFDGTPVDNLRVELYNYEEG